MNKNFMTAKIVGISILMCCMLLTGCSKSDTEARNEITKYTGSELYNSLGREMSANKILGAKNPMEPNSVIKSIEDEISKLQKNVKYLEGEDYSKNAFGAKDAQHAYIDLQKANIDILKEAKSLIKANGFVRRDNFSKYLQWMYPRYQQATMEVDINTFLYGDTGKLAHREWEHVNKWSNAKLSDVYYTSSLHKGKLEISIADCNMKSADGKTYISVAYNVKNISNKTEDISFITARLKYNDKIFDKLDFLESYDFPNSLTKKYYDANSKSSLNPDDTACVVMNYVLPYANMNMVCDPIEVLYGITLLNSIHNDNSYLFPHYLAYHKFDDYYRVEKPNTNFTLFKPTKYLDGDKEFPMYNDDNDKPEYLSLPTSTLIYLRKFANSYVCEFDFRIIYGQKIKPVHVEFSIDKNSKKITDITGLVYNQRVGAAKPEQFHENPDNDSKMVRMCKLLYEYHCVEKIQKNENNKHWFFE